MIDYPVNNFCLSKCGLVHSIVKFTNQYSKNKNKLQENCTCFFFIFLYILMCDFIPIQMSSQKVTFSTKISEDAKKGLEYLSRVEKRTLSALIEIMVMERVEKKKDFS